MVPILHDRISSQYANHFMGIHLPLILTLLLFLPSHALLPRFRDVTEAAGLLQPGPSFKWGGPCVADLDGDGHYDLILSSHNGLRLRIYFGSSQNFTLSSFRTIHFDIHGVAVAPYTAMSNDKMLSISIGGGSATNLKVPEVYLVDKQKNFTYVSNRLGLNRRKGRGRNTVFMDLSQNNRQQKRRNLGGPDLIFVNFLGRTRNGLRQNAYRNTRGTFSLESIPGFADQWRGRVEVTDINDDGKMELISIRELRFYQLVKPFYFEDATDKFLPEGLDVGILTVTAVAEIDYDNDGDFDLYVARTDRTVVTNLKKTDARFTNDILLENQGGVYVDVSEKLGIPKSTNSVGVTVADMNNDGFVDVVVSLYKEPDMILLNKGGRNFQRVDGLIPKETKTVGNNAVAVDYDGDGKVDLAVGQGDVQGRKGFYLLLKNIIPKTVNRHYLLVHVGHAPGRGVTSLHAKVTVFVGDMKMVRRVGSNGAQGGGGSFLDTLHFGLGRATTVKRVRVEWTNGVTQQRWRVKADARIEFGVSGMSPRK